MKLTRRTFIRTAGGITFSLIGFLYPGIQAPLSRVASSSPEVSRGTAPTGRVTEMGGLDPSYAGGEVVEKTTEGVILKSDTGVRAVRIPAETSIWKEFDVGPNAIQLHDWLDVKGEPLPDGSLLARSGWVFVNIGRRDGVFEGLSGGGMKLNYDNRTENVELSSRLEVISATDGKPLAGGMAALMKGTQIGMVGLRLPNGGFRATRIWTK